MLKDLIPQYQRQFTVATKSVELHFFFNLDPILSNTNRETDDKPYHNG